MKYLLDTNTCIRILNQRNEGLIRRMKSISPDELVVCSVTRAELLVGALKSYDPETAKAKRLAFLEPFVSLPFDDAAADYYAFIRTKLEANGTPIGPNDLIIASIALTYKLILVTHNTREFSRIHELRIEDWEIESHNDV